MKGGDAVIDVPALFLVCLRKLLGSVPHNISFEKLIQIGLDVRLVTWLKKVLGERRQKVMLYGIALWQGGVQKGSAGISTRAGFIY